MTLYLTHIVKIEEDTRSVKDRRFKVKSIIASYTGEDNQEYRKRFEAKGEPKVPKTGTHEYLNNLRKQY